MPSQRNDRVPRTDRCRECGRAVSPDANFCPGCGADLRAEDPLGNASSTYCTECGELVGPDDEFCANCGAPCEGAHGPTAEADDPTAETTATADPDARRAFRARVRDHLDAGWELTEDHGDRVVLVDRDIGSLPVHVLLLPTTGGVGNLLYGWYNYAEQAETRRLGVSDGPLPDGELATPGDEDPLVTLSGYLLGGLLLLIGAGIAAVSVGAGSVLGTLFGLAFAAIGLALSPPVERRLDRRHGLSRFGRVRTVDHRITPATERTEAPCVVCGEAFERGVVRRRRDETVVAGVPVRTHSIRRNHYCADCARAELFGGDSGADASSVFVPDSGTDRDSELDIDSELDTRSAADAESAVDRAE
ncbi:zinc ribbon domain-containing protein [Halorubrum salipaludis]|uniref:Zinc ribbon domain-containing protein n=1 Tax=Halorubrum salipaludis TaxID=2032630 RepID=A0A2A2FIZ9_9EURY|nr:zinc ribbon domain-containing protein [Halorubrum salipaludis]PAU84647.1 zinc ribbon domain-containing protein [Halorubrum salipaludis]